MDNSEFVFFIAIFLSENAATPGGSNIDHPRGRYIILSDQLVYPCYACLVYVSHRGKHETHQLFGLRLTPRYT